MQIILISRKIIGGKILIFLLLPGWYVTTKKTSEFLTKFFLSEDFTRFSEQIFGFQKILLVFSILTLLPGNFMKEISRQKPSMVWNRNDLPNYVMGDF